MLVALSVSTALNRKGQHLLRFSEIAVVLVHLDHVASGCDFIRLVYDFRYGADVANPQISTPARSDWLGNAGPSGQSLPPAPSRERYQEYKLAPVEALAAIPNTLSDAEAGPVLCAEVTTFNALRHSGASPGDLVAVQGVGGLGHLGIQFANKFGLKVAAIGRGSENAALARRLGASVYIDRKTTNVVKELQKLGVSVSPRAKLSHRWRE